MNTVTDAKSELIWVILTLVMMDLFRGKQKSSKVNVVTFKEPGTNKEQGSLLSVYLLHFTNITLLNDVQ